MTGQDSRGFDARAFLATTTRRPGIYQMFDVDSALLYVGKAKNLHARLSSYFRNSGLAVKTQALVAKIAHIEVVVTGSETEALLLEQNLIKQHRPPYNILLRDDKSYPYLFVSSEQIYPALSFHRGAKRRKGRYFGPFPSGGAVRESLSLLQRVFRLRQCEDSYFNNRSRPCLQYQIERCSAPCVGLISPAQYAEDLRYATLFLEGRNQQLTKELADSMEQASMALAFEEAARLRDQIQNLQKVQEQQRISSTGGNLDLLACSQRAGYACILQLFVRGGRVVGSKAHFPKLVLEAAEAELLSCFVAQHYLSQQMQELPDQIVTSHPLEDAKVLEQALAEARRRRTEVLHQVRSHRRAWLELALSNAENQLAVLLNSRKSVEKRFVELQEALSLDQLPTRLECFDISHSSGEATVASCVVFDGSGPRKSDYRRFNIESTDAGDDYAAMHEALQRRYARIKRGEVKAPDLLVIDGGKGQVRQAEEVITALQLDVRVLGIAKGPTRKAGLEILIWEGREITLSAHSGALHLLQHIRDEAHRFAVAGHRARRGKARTRSQLDEIPGVGSKRRQALLKHFGSLQGISSASVEEIAKVSTISRSMAETIYACLHEE